MNRDHVYLVCAYALAGIPLVLFAYDTTIVVHYIGRPFVSFIYDFQQLTEGGKIAASMGVLAALEFNAAMIIRTAMINLKHRSQAEYLRQASEE
jgi:hypothetical protein